MWNGGWEMQVFASKDAQIEDLKKRLAATEKQRAKLEKAHAPCQNIIAGLKKDLAAAKAEHEPCAAQIKELKAHLARLDKKLAQELEKEEALAKELAEEKRKEAELEQSLKKTKADLEKDEIMTEIKKNAKWWCFVPMVRAIDLRSTSSRYL